jgi:hypothetical protein
VHNRCFGTSMAVYDPILDSFMSVQMYLAFLLPQCKSVAACKVLLEG